MEIKATSDTSYSAYKQFYKTTIKKIMCLYIVLEIIVSFMILTSLVNVITAGIESLGSLVVSLLLLIMTVGITIYLPRISYKRTNIKDSKPDCFTFTDNNINIVSEAKGIVSEATLEYGAFLKAYENKRYVYLYLAKDRAFLIDKNTVSGGNYDRVREKIINEMGLKNYVIKL